MNKLRYIWDMVLKHSEKSRGYYIPPRLGDVIAHYYPDQTAEFLRERAPRVLPAVVTNLGVPEIGGAHISKIRRRVDDGRRTGVAMVCARLLKDPSFTQVGLAHDLEYLLQELIASCATSRDSTHFTENVAGALGINSQYLRCLLGMIRANGLFMMRNDPELYQVWKGGVEQYLSAFNYRAPSIGRHTKIELLDPTDTLLDGTLLESHDQGEVIFNCYGPLGLYRYFLHNPSDDGSGRNNPRARGLGLLLRSELEFFKVVLDRISMSPKERLSL